MVDAATWRIAPEHLDESVRELREYMDDEGASVLVKIEGEWLPLLEVNAEQAEAQAWDGVAEGVCIEGDCSTTLGSLAGVEPGPVRLRHDDAADGLVISIGDRVVVVIAGPELQELPEGLLHLEGADLSLDALKKVAASGLGKSLVSLDVGGSEELGSERSPKFVELFPNLRELALSDFEELEDLEPLTRLTSLERLNLDGCKALRDVGPLAKLTHLTSLDLSGCESISDLTPLTDLPLTELSLSECSRLPDLAPLVRIISLTSLDLSECELLESVAALRACGNLQELDLAGSPEVRDVHLLSDSASLRALGLDDNVTAARILAGCAVRRVDAPYVEQYAEAWLEQMDLAPSPAEFVEDVLPALSLGGGAPWAVEALENLVERAVRAGIAERGTWQLIFDALLSVGDPACRKGVELALSSLTPGSDPAPIVGPALDVLTRVPDSGSKWALGLADATLDPLITTPRASSVAALAVKFYARIGHPQSLDPWLELLVQPTRTPSSEKKKPKADQNLPSLEEDPAALSGLVARLVQKQPDSPPVSQLVAALVGLARERPDSHTVEPFVDHFAQLVRQRSESVAVARLADAYSAVMLSQPDSTPARVMVEKIAELVKAQPEHPLVQRLTAEFLGLLTEQPDNPAVAQFTAMLDAARDAGVGVFARRVLAHPSLQEKTDGEELGSFASLFDGREARRALIRGLIEKLCSEDILRNKPKNEVMAALERDLVDID